MQSSPQRDGLTPISLTPSLPSCQSNSSCSLPWSHTPAPCVCVCVCVCVCARACECECVCVCVCVCYLFVYQYLAGWLCLWLCVCASASLCVCVCGCLCLWLCACVYDMFTNTITLTVHQVAPLDSRLYQCGCSCGVRLTTASILSTAGQ